MINRSRLLLWASGGALALALGIGVGSLVSDQSSASGFVMEVNTTLKDEPITVSRAGEGGALVCAEGTAGQFCTLGTSEVPAIGVTESADGAVRITLLDPKRQGLKLVLTSGENRTIVPATADSTVLVTRAQSVPELIEAVDVMGQVVASYDGARLSEMRDGAARAAEE